MSNGARLTSASVAIRKMAAPTGWMTTNHSELCASTISSRRIESASRMAVTKARPRDNSYEIICAEERNPPSMAYLLLLDQPASTMPYTAIEAMDMIYKTPTLIFETCSRISRPNKLNDVPSGITAARISEGTTVNTGASTNTTL